MTSGPIDRIITRDEFDRDVRRGRVIGSTTGHGARRLGVDRWRSMAVDHGALRIVSLRRPGWGSTSLACQSVVPHDGLAFAVLALNGHNTAQAEPLDESIMRRFKRWMRGNEVEPWGVHVIRWLCHGRKRWTANRFVHWLRIDHQTRRGTVLYLDENFSVGFTPEVSSVPTVAGNSFVMHATGADNGELWVVADGLVHRVLPGVRNVPLYLLSVIREGTVVHFGASIDGVRGLPALPSVRPLAVMPLANGAFFHPTVQQSVSSQIGFAADTRVWETIVADLAAWMLGDGAPVIDADLSLVAVGDTERWNAAGGAGLLRLLVETGTHFELGFRVTGSDGWSLAGSSTSIQLVRRHGGVDDVAAEVAGCWWSADADRHRLLDVQVTDDGARIGVVVDGTLVFDRWVDDRRDASGGTVTLRILEGSARSLHAYRRTHDLPVVLRPTSSIDQPLSGLTTTLLDQFEGPRGELDGRRIGDRSWRKSGGVGRCVVTGEASLAIDATASSPVPGRVVYTVPSPGVSCAEIEIVVVPPGTERGRGERGRAGVIFEQEDGDALIVSTWLDDGYSGASISSFFRLGGYEDLYDAIWTNVGSSVTWGRPYRLRVAFDGLVYEVFLDDELVIYRSLADVDPRQPALSLDRVGLVANWEWGTDTGSVFRSWTLRTSR